MANYGTVAGADTYFEHDLFADVWKNSQEDKKLSALVTATRAIDKLSYKGYRTESDQELQFPRNGDVTVPIDIEIATYLLANELLKSAPIDNRVNGAMLQSTMLGSVVQGSFKNEAREGNPPAHMIAGIVSYSAWQLLYRYLNDPMDIVLV